MVEIGSFLQSHIFMMGKVDEHMYEYNFSLSTVTCDWLQASQPGLKFLKCYWDFSLHHYIQNDSGAHSLIFTGCLALFLLG